MNKFFLLLSAFLTTSHVFADNLSIFDAHGFITRQHALACIQINKDMALASQQMIATETRKSHLKSKISYLHNEIQKRRKIIEKLDQQHNQNNNENYNQLITQFENLVDEHKQTIAVYDDKHQLHVTQHESVIRLEQRFSDQCLHNIQITQDMHQEVCQLENIRWCNLFKF